MNLVAKTRSGDMCPVSDVVELLVDDDKKILCIQLSHFKVIGKGTVTITEVAPNLEPIPESK